MEHFMDINPAATSNDTTFQVYKPLSRTLKGRREKKEQKNLI